MTFKVKVHYIDKKDGTLKKLFFSRAVRQLSNLRPCINYSGKIYKIFPFKENVIDSVMFDIDSPEEVSLHDCPFVTSEEAKTMLEHLIPASHLPLNPKIIESFNTKTTDDIGPDAPDFVFTDPMNISMSLVKEKKEAAIQPKVAFHKLNIPVFNDDWFIERTKWYIYVLVNEDKITESNERIDFISTVLEEPKDFKLPNSAYFHIDHTIFSKIFLQKFQDNFTQGCLTTYKEFLLDEPIALNQHKTFYDKWGECDFEDRDSIRPSVNGVMYDHWFRFDLSYSDEQLRSLFHDIFSIHSMHLVAPNILSVNRGFEIHGDASIRPNIYLDPPIVKSPEPEIDNKAWIKELESDNELVADMNRVLQESLDNVTLEHMQAEETISVLKNDIERAKEKQKKQIDNTLKTFFDQEIIFMRRGKKVLRNFESPDGVYKTLQHLIRDETAVPKKTVERTSHWLEVAKKINTGKDEQGRIYIYKTNSNPTRFVVLVGHKLDQKSDIEYLRKNDPPQEWDK